MTEDAREDAENLEADTGDETFDFKLDRNNLFQEETFTDVRNGSVKRFTPIRPDGTPDKSRKTIYLGQTSLYTPEGPLPLQNVIAAKDLAQAFKRFPEAMEEAVQRLMEEAKKMKDEKASPIIQTPESRIIMP
jgi:hypothetical protein